MSEESKWIITKYPEPYKDVLVFDLFCGYHIAYYDNVMGVFYTKDLGSSLNNVTAWQPLPCMPSEITPLKQRVQSRYGLTLQGTKRNENV